MAPSELLNDHIAVKKNLSHMYRMIAADFVVRHALILTGVLIFKETLTNLVLQGSEVFLEVLVQMLLLLQRR